MQDFRPTLLHHVLALVPFEGWSEAAIQDAAQQSGISAIECKQAFPSGVQDCVRYYFAQIDEATQAHFADGSLATKRIPERIEALIMTRLTLMQPHREAVKRAASGQLLPWKTTEALHSLFSLTDSMWRLAGDTSTDFNYYTKRMTLAAVYSSTFLFWLNDDSINLQSTHNFLKRRLNNVAQFGKKKKSLLSTLQSFSYYKKR